MITMMITFMYVSCFLAVAASAIVCINYLTVKDGYNVIEFDPVNKNILTCRKAAFVFTFLAWLMNSFEAKKTCLEGYQKLSKVCSRLGYVWLIYAFACIAVCILMSVRKKRDSLIQNVAKFRNNGFFMGVVFLIISFLLNVE